MIAAASVSCSQRKRHSNVKHRELYSEGVIFWRERQTSPYSLRLPVCLFQSPLVLLCFGMGDLISLISHAIMAVSPQWPSIIYFKQPALECQYYDCIFSVIFPFLGELYNAYIVFQSFSALTSPCNSFWIFQYPLQLHMLESNSGWSCSSKWPTPKNAWLHFKGAKHSCMTFPGLPRWNWAHVCFLFKTMRTLRISVSEYRPTCFSLYSNIAWANTTESSRE